MVFRLTPALVIHVPSVEPDMASGRPDAKPMPIMTKTRLLRNTPRNAPMHTPSPACAERANFRFDSFVCAREAEWRRGGCALFEKDEMAGPFARNALARGVQLPNSETRNQPQEK